jgi:hypothetical protein
MYFITREDPIPGFYKRNTTEDLPGKICRWQYYFITREDPIPGFYKRNTTEDLPAVTCGRLMISSTNKTGCHDITEILLNVTLNTMTLTLTPEHDRFKFNFFLHLYREIFCLNLIR